MRPAIGPVALGNVSGATTIDLSLGETFIATLTGNVTFNVTNTRTRARFVLDLTMGGAGGYTVTVTDEVNPSGDNAFATTLVGSRTIVEFASGDGSVRRIARNSTPGA